MNKKQGYIMAIIALCAAAAAVAGALAMSPGASAPTTLKAEVAWVEFHDAPRVFHKLDRWENERRYLKGNAQFDEDYKQLQEKFLYKNTPISAAIIREFIPQAYGDQNHIASIDIASCWNQKRFRNKKYEYTVLENNQFQCREITNVNEEEREHSYLYRWIGRLDNGLHVVLFEDCEGSDFATNGNLLFFKISQAEAFDAMGDSYKQMLLTLVREYGLGHGCYYNHPDISISGNKVFFKPMRCYDREGNLHLKNSNYYDEGTMEFKD